MQPWWSGEDQRTIVRGAHTHTHRAHFHVSDVSLTPSRVMAVGTHLMTHHTVDSTQTRKLVRRRDSLAAVTQ